MEQLREIELHYKFYTYNEVDKWFGKLDVQETRRNQSSVPAAEAFSTVQYHCHKLAKIIYLW